MVRVPWGVAVVVLSGCLEPAPLAEPDVLSAVADAGPYICSPLTCTGCCRDNVCLGGNHQTACGYSGRECKTCDNTTRCESPGACFALPNDGGVRPKSDPTKDFRLPCFINGGRLYCGG